VRHVALALALVVAAAAPARGDDDGPEYVPAAKRSIGFGIVGHASRIGGVSEGGGGPSLELAVGVGRWQPFAEAAVSSAGFESWTMPAAESRIDGWMARGGLGVRWIATQFMLEPGAAFEMYLETFGGFERFWWNAGGRLTRPDVGVGVGTQVRVWKPFHTTIRLDARIVFTPGDRNGLWVSCRGSCPPSSQSTSSTGLMAGLGWAWR
jgi:hypothetical protein